MNAVFIGVFKQLSDENKCIVDLRVFFGNWIAGWKLRCNNETRKNDVINGKHGEHNEERIKNNVTNWEDQLFWMTQAAVFVPVVVLVFFGWCLLKCKLTTHTTSC